MIKDISEEKKERENILTKQICKTKKMKKSNANQARFIQLISLLIVLNITNGNEIWKSQSIKNWEEWSSWSSCSKNCSNGIMTRTRTCTDSHRKFDARCIGKRVEYKVCNQQPCPGNHFDVKRFRCSQYNGRHVHGIRVRSWIPNINVTNPCQLSCLAKLPNSKPLVYSFGKVDDGSLCNNNKHLVCLNGRCTPVGCDGIIASNRTEDKCGVCGGKSNTCHKVKHVLTNPINWLTQETSRIIGNISFGARHIIIKEGTANFLNGNESPIINNPQVQGPLGTYKGMGTQFEYSYKPHDGHEVIRADGPIDDTLYIMVVKRENASKLYYEYWMPNNPEKNPKNVSNHNSQKLNNKNVATQGIKKRKTKIPTEPSNQINKTPDKVQKCPLCEPNKNIKKHFCKSDFALRVVVTGTSTINSQTRYELEVIQSFKNSVHLQSREFLWVPRICKCPKITNHREYVIMGILDKNVVKKEVKLVVDGNSYIRRFSHKRARQLYRLKKDRAKICGDDKIKNKTK